MIKIHKKILQWIQKLETSPMTLLNMIINPIQVLHCKILH